MMKLEEKLVALRKEKGISQLKLAEMVGVSRQAVSRWEVGSAIPSTDNLKYLGELYGVSVDLLLNDDETVPPHKEESKDNVAKRTSLGKQFRWLVFVLCIIFFFVVVYLVTTKDKKTQIGEMKEDPWDTVGTEEFLVEW